MFDWITYADRMAALGGLFLILLAVACWFLVESWELQYIRSTAVYDRYTTRFIRKVMDTPTEEIQLLHWQVFDRDSVLRHGSWYVFQLTDGGYIVEQYDEDLNWQFYTPHTDYVCGYAHLKNGTIQHRVSKGRQTV